MGKELREEDWVEHEELCPYNSAYPFGNPKHFDCRCAPFCLKCNCDSEDHVFDREWDINEPWEYLKMEDGEIPNPCINCNECSLELTGGYYA